MTQLPMAIGDCDQCADDTQQLESQVLDTAQEAARISARSPDAVDGRAAALDLHEGIATPGGCERWPNGLRLRSSDGRLVPGRCRATNLCAYCARLFAVETSEMLLLDAMEDAPTLLVVLTARELLERADCRDHLTKLRRSLGRRWPHVRWAVLVEFQRRGALHLNLLVKGVPSEDAQALHEAVSAVWCARVDASPRAQSVTPIWEVGGAVRYVSQHFMKPAQAPPIGWRGHRYSATRDYLVRPASVMRQEARESLRHKRHVWKLHQQAEREDLDLHAADVEDIASALCERDRLQSWQLVQLNELGLVALGRADRGYEAERFRRWAWHAPA